jgi:hypothetical protein
MKNFLLFLSSTLVLSCAVFAQSSRSPQSDDKKVVLSGTVYDTNGAVIPFSHVLAQSPAGKEYRTTTNEEGVYKIELLIDIYAIKVDAPGFCSSRVRFFRVRKSPSGATPLDVVLDVADGDRPCKQKTMIEREPKKPVRKIRKPEIFRSIAE